MAAIALLYVALVTPVEVSFIETMPCPARWTSSLFLINRVVDVIFIIDLMLQFRVAYKEENVHGARWVTDPRSIALHYVLSVWFPLDLFSILTSIFDFLCGDDADNLILLRAVRTLRLVKLIKLARGSRIFKRWEMRLSVNYSILQLVFVTVGVLLICHWTACIWGLVGSFDHLNSWLGEKEYCVPWDSNSQPCPFTMEQNYPLKPVTYPMCTPERCTGEFESFTGQSSSAFNSSVEYHASCTTGYACLGAFEMYTYSLYFSIMTITSVGFGDISATKFNLLEQIVCSVIMLLTAMVWGYLIKASCSCPHQRRTSKSSATSYRS